MTRTASSVGMSEANAPKHLKAGSVEGLETPTEDMLMAARGLIMARDMGLPNQGRPLGEVARSGFYGNHWAHILTDEERSIQSPLTKAHFAQLIWRAMESARLSLTLEGEG